MLTLAYAVDNLDVGGTELNAVRTAERLDRQRFRVLVVLFGPEGPLKQRYEVAGIPVFSCPIGSLRSPRILPQGLRLMRILARERVDVFHAHDVYSNTFGVPWARLAGVPAVIASRRWFESVPRPIHRVANRLAFRIAHRVLGNSPAVIECLQTEDGVPASRTICIPNFVAEDAFLSLGSRDRRLLQEKLGIPEGRLVIGCVARLAPVKDHATLLRAVALLAPHWPALSLVLVGDGPSRKQLEQLRDELGLGGVVIFAGRHLDGRFHHAFDVSVLTSRSEGFPNAIVEAMAAGRAVVATDVGGTADAVQHDVTGLLVPPGDAVKIASALGQLLASPERRCQMGLAARTRAYQNYHERAIIAELSNLYESLVPKPRRRTTSWPS